ncbi:MAG: D-aminoacyl-tRNA deacylase [Actinomycetota bacterium]|nr:D-aminoacyl-tRNA deacylase [Actinomycetota bacterium]
MRAVVQRVKKGRVWIGDKVLAEIGQGLVVLLGISREDTQSDAAYMIDKITNLRIFEDDEGKLNLSVKQIGGEILIVSQFTLHGNCRKGRRPSFVDAAPADRAIDLYRQVISGLRGEGLIVREGKFQEIMTVEIVNYGPVTLLVDSKKTF